MPANNEFINQLISKAQQALDEICDNDEEFRAELLDAYLENLVEFKESFLKSIQQNDVELMKNGLHKIKPTICSLGFQEHYDLLSELKSNLSSGNNDQKVDLAVKLVDEIREVLQRI